MNPDDFEQRLQRQPMRDVPAQWRSQILSAAHAAAGSTRHAAADSEFTSLDVRAELISWLWPSPKVWVGLAVIWLLLAGANRAIFSQNARPANSEPHPDAASLAAWKEQSRILAELMQPAESSAAEAASRAKPRPRSERTGLPRMS